MATILFDFDSTLIDCESLEELLFNGSESDRQLREQFQTITDRAMSGELPFAEALEARLKLAPPNLAEVEAFAARAHERLSSGMQELLTNLHNRNAQVWIVSGGLKEILDRVGGRLGIPEERIHGSKLLWDHDGKFRAVDKECLFCASKVAGMRALGAELGSPSIVVGDGMTDFDLFGEGVVDHFVAYTEHVYRQPVVERTNYTASNSRELQEILEKLIDGS